MKLSVLTLAGLISLIGASPVSPSRTLGPRQGNGTSSAPCAQVSEFMYGDGTQTVKTDVPAGLAFACLSSVPFNATSARKLIASIRPYINWQSTLDQLKSPPAEYAEKVQPPIDILQGLNMIEGYIDANTFTSEYDFGWTLYTLIQSAHDGHFSYIPDSVGQIFLWGRPVPLVSVSEDGVKLPSVFVYADVIGSQFKNISYDPSPVVQIDGQDANEFLENLSQRGSLQDRDALYNNVFYELAQVSLGSSGTVTGMFTGGGRGRYVYPGDTTTLKFANGSEYTMQNYARPSINLRGINSGEDIAKKWFSWGTANDGTASVKTTESDKPEIISTAAVNAAGSAPGYPVPIVAGPVNLINGFFIDSPGYEHVAVLSIPNFVGAVQYENWFQQTTQEFIPKALAEGKTKLILDVQANGGGTILQGYDLFKQLFPDMDPYGASRFRAHEAIDLMGKAFSAVASLGPRTGKGNVTIQNAQSSYFDYHTDTTVDGKPFSSWAEKYGPEKVNGAMYTTLARWNLSDVFIPANSGGINVTGYNSLANVTGPPKFKPENIVIVTDGYCASTCGIFTEFLTQQAGVKTIAMGGRSNKDPIQAIGGVKGVNNFAFSYIQQQVQYAVRFNKSLNDSMLRRDYYSDLPFIRGTSFGVNNRDGLRKNDTSGIALQFVYEEADCRLYYTPEMTVDVTAIWKAAADAQWGNSSKCVKGSGEKRDIRRNNIVGVQEDRNEITTKLGRRSNDVNTAAAAKVFALEASFGLETDCKMAGDGFMDP